MSIDKEKLNKLLEIAAIPTQEKVKPVVDYSDAYQFSLFCELEQGTETVPAFLIYNLYKEWKKDKDIDTKVRFFTDFKQYFDKKSKASGVFYLLNMTAHDLEKKFKEKMYA